MEIQTLLTAEAECINRMLRSNNIFAKVTPSGSIYKDATSGFIRYALILREDQSFRAIETIQRELSAVVSHCRQRFGLSVPVQVMPVSTPIFGLEVPHPLPQKLLWSYRNIVMAKPHTMLLGQSYNGNETKIESMDLADSGSCHALVVGITGAGKSVLMQNMLLSLTANTSPDELKIVLIDLKNQDMLPFRNLPHVLNFSGNREDARSAIEYVCAEKEKRIKQIGYKPYRLLLWIDEMAQLASMNGMADMLGDLASIGRGKLINLIGATQHPTDKGGMGGLLKANFPVRLVGQVAPGQSYVATGRKELHTDLLPGHGAFLRLQGPTVQRFQSFWIDEDGEGEVSLMARKIVKHWQTEPTKLVPEREARSLVYVNAEPGVEPVLEPVQNRFFPLSEKRPLSDKEALEARRLNEEMSKNALCILIYGSKNGRYADWLNEALQRTIPEGKIIKMGRKI
jgi:hypothetical protein